MTKLNLLGAQRVKALSDILDRKYEDVINEAKNLRKRGDEAEKELLKHLGLYDKFLEVSNLIAVLRQEAKPLRDIGYDIDTDLHMLRYKLSDDHRQILDGIYDNGSEEMISDLRRELEDKKSKLWLVETLEEAQAIVNSEIGVFPNRKGEK